MYHQQYNWGPQPQQRQGPLGGGSGDFLQTNMMKQGKKQGGNANIPKGHFKNDEGNPMAEGIIAKMAGKVNPVLGMIAGPLMAARRKANQWIVPDVPIKGVDGGALQTSTQPLQVAGAGMYGGQQNPYGAATSMSEEQRKMLMGGGAYG